MFYVYLYYALDNRGGLFRSIFQLSSIIRLIVSRLPSFFKKVVCDILAHTIYVPLVYFGKGLDLFGFKKLAKKIPLSSLRPTLNLMTGLDFNLPTGGPLGDVATESRFKGDNDTRVNEAATRNTDTFVYFEIDKADRAKGNDPDPQKQVTDDLGLSKIWLVGKPKVPAILSGSIDVPKKAEVYVTLTLNSAKDIKQNVVDFSGFVLGVVQSVGESGIDPIAFTTALIGAGAEVGYRTPFTAARAVVPLSRSFVVSMSSSIINIFDIFLFLVVGMFYNRSYPHCLKTRVDVTLYLPDEKGQSMSLTVGNVLYGYQPLSRVAIRRESSSRLNGLAR